MFLYKDIKQLESLNVSGKTVFLRLDLNVPIKDGVISDTTRIQAALPTIQYLLDHNAKLLIASHLGRPKGKDDRKKLSMLPIAEKLGELIERDVVLIEDLKSDVTKSFLKNIKANQVLMLENLRFTPSETKNEKQFAQFFADFIDVYVNDAFGCVHRAHMSVEALPRLIKKKAMGFLMKKELMTLSKLTTDPEKPFYAVLGGAKVSDKIQVIESLIDQVDGFVIGGAMAYTFLTAINKPVGKSLVEPDYVKLALSLIDRIEARGKKIYLPQDHVVVKDFSMPQTKGLRSVDEVGANEIAVDIGPKTIKEYCEVLKSAKTIFWNGPMGAFETPEYAEGTFAIAQALADNEEAFTVIGGGDSAAAINQSGLQDKISFISTGGGASLDLLQGKPLPGLIALKPFKQSEQGV